MTGKMLSIKIFVTGANLEKLEKIRQYLNSQTTLKAAMLTTGQNRKFISYFLTMRSKTSNFRQDLSCLFPVRWCFLSGSFSAARFPKCLFALLRRFISFVVKLI